MGMMHYFFKPYYFKYVISFLLNIVLFSENHKYSFGNILKNVINAKFVCKYYFFKMVNVVLFKHNNYFNYYFYFKIIEVIKKKTITVNWDNITTENVFKVF